MPASPAYTQLGALIRPHPYHLYFLIWILATVLIGTACSLYYGTHLYSVTLSALKFTDAAEYQRMAQAAPHGLINRHNWVNQIFVKRAWLWNTLVIAAIGATLKRTAGGLRGEHKRTEALSSADLPMRILSSRTLARWAEATLGWIVFAVWFFGPSFSQRVSIATGAVCILGGEQVDVTNCNSRGTGRWSGGHDVSGHTFILALGMFLILETLVPYFPYVLPSFSLLRKSIPYAIYADRDIFRTGQPRTRLVNVAVFWASVMLVGLWSTMLVVTSVYHHYAIEKVTGLLYAIFVWVLMPKEHALP